MSGFPSISDVLVVGGGPAGACTAARLASLGVSVVVAERQRFPRFHIGESLLPASNRILHRLGLRAAMEEAEFVRKRGASFCNADGSVSGRVDFGDSTEVSEPVTYHVPRDRFDTLLLERASSLGAEVRHGWSVRRIDVGKGDPEVSLSHPREGTVTARARFVVDASGQAGVLAKSLGLRRPDPRLRNVAIHSRFEGLARPSGVSAGDLRIVSLSNLGWVWFIPLSATSTSVGVVLPRRVDKELRIGAAGGVELEQALRDIPVLRREMRRARRTHPVRREADFSYDTRRYAGDRWALVGDSAAFLDPVFSTGVTLALASGWEAAEAIHRVLRGRRGSDPALRRWEARQRRRYGFYRRFARAFYRREFRDLFLQPSDRLGLSEAMVAALAGIWPLSPWTRLRISLFFALVFAQRWIRIAPRVSSSGRPDDLGSSWVGAAADGPAP